MLTYCTFQTSVLVFIILSLLYIYIYYILYNIYTFLTTYTYILHIYTYIYLYNISTYIFFVSYIPILNTYMSITIPIHLLYVYEYKDIRKEYREHITHHTRTHSGCPCCASQRRDVAPCVGSAALSTVTDIYSIYVCDAPPKTPISVHKPQTVAPRNSG